MTRQESVDLNAMLAAAGNNGNTALESFPLFMKGNTIRENSKMQQN